MPCTVFLTFFHVPFLSWSLCAIPLYSSLPSVVLQPSWGQEGQGQAKASPSKEHQVGPGAGVPGDCKSWACLAWQRKVWQGGDPFAVFNSLCLPTIPKTSFLFIWWQYMNKRLRKFPGFLGHALHVTCIQNCEVGFSEQGSEVAYWHLWKYWLYQVSPYLFELLVLFLLLCCNRLTGRMSSV